MIKKIIIKNFQSHKTTELIPSKNVTVIKGSSHGGKSAVVRSLNWNLFNRPSGISFKRHNATQKEAVSVVLETENAVVERKRTKAANKYILTDAKNNKVTFEALRTDIPEEVKSALNLTNINFQSQHDGFFLLQDTAGEVGKKLNNIVGLDIIDKTQKTILNLINEAKRDAKSKKSFVEETNKKIASFDFLHEAKKLLNKIEVKNENILQRSKKVNDLNNLVSSIDITENSLKDTEKWLCVEKEYIKIIANADKFYANSAVKIKLDELCVAILSISENIANNNVWITGVEDSSTTLLKDSAKIEKKKSSLTELSSLLQNIDQTKCNIATLNTTVNTKIAELCQIERDLGVCPLCGNKFKGE